VEAQKREALEAAGWRVGDAADFLRVSCELDRNLYPSGIKVSKEDMAGIRLRKSN
jgi:hypothetical protein